MIRAFDYLRGHEQLKEPIEEAIQSVLRSGQLILGPEVAAFEAEFAAYAKAQFGVGVGCGTDAITMALRAVGVGPEDEVITVANTAVGTVAAIRATGASVRFVDVSDDNLLIDTDALAQTIGPKTRAIVPVHLYGQPADLDRIMQISAEHQLAVVEDCAQAHGATYREKQVGTFGQIGCFSFYPTKNLGAYGDGGMCLTSDDDLQRQLRELRMYGFRGDGIAHRDGFCTRLDEVQAAILRVKLPHLNEANEARRRIAKQYRSALAGSHYRLLKEVDKGQSVYHQFVVRTPHRQSVITACKKNEIGFGIHYPTPIHLMPAYDPLGYRPGDLPITERAASEILSLPMYPELKDAEVNSVIDVLLNVDGIAQ